MSRPDERLLLWYREGHFVDIKNVDGEWTIGLIKAVDNVRGFNVFYEDNGKPVQMWVGKASERLAPFRQQSTNRELTLATRKSGQNLTEAIRTIHAVLSQEERDPMSVVQKYRGELIYRVLELIETGPKNESEIADYLETIKVVVRFACAWMGQYLQNKDCLLDNLKTKDTYLSDISHANVSCWPEIFELLNRLLTSKTSAQRSLSRSAHSEHSVHSMALQEFREQGFVQLAHQVTQGSLPFHILGSLPIWTVFETLQNQYMAEFSNCIAATIKQGKGLSVLELRYFDPSVLKLLFANVFQVAVVIAQSVPGLLKDLEDMVLDIATKLLQDRDRLEARIQGLRVYAFAIARSAPGVVGTFALRREDIATYLMNSALPVLFSESNTEAVNLSVPIFELLAEEGRLTPVHVTNLLKQQGHESTITARAQLLVKIAPKCDADLLNQIVETWKRQELKSATVAIMKEFTMSANQSRSEVHPCFLTLFLEVLQKPTPQANKLLFDIFKAITDILKTPALESMQEPALDQLAAEIERHNIESLKCFHHVIFGMHEHRARDYMQRKQPSLHRTILQWIREDERSAATDYDLPMFLSFMLSLITFIAALDETMQCLTKEYLNEMKNVFVSKQYPEPAIELFFKWISQLADNPKTCSPDIFAFISQLLSDFDSPFIKKAGQNTWDFFHQRFLYANEHLISIRGQYLVLVENSEMLGLERLFDLTHDPENKAIRMQASSLLCQLIFRCKAGIPSILAKYFASCFDFLANNRVLPVYLSQLLSAILYLIDYYLQLTAPEPAEAVEAGIRVTCQKNGMNGTFIVPAAASFRTARKAFPGPYHRMVFRDANQWEFFFVYDDYKMANFGTEVFFYVSEHEVYDPVDPFAILLSDSSYFQIFFELFTKGTTNDVQEQAWKLISKLVKAYPIQILEILGGWKRILKLMQGTEKEQLLILYLLECLKGPSHESADNLQRYALDALERINSQHDWYASQFQSLSPELVFQYCVKLVSLAADGNFPAQSSDQPYNDRILLGMCFVYKTYANVVANDVNLFDSEPFKWRDVVISWAQEGVFSLQSNITQFLSDGMLQQVFLRSTNEKLKESFGEMLAGMKDIPFSFDSNFDQILINFLRTCLDIKDINTEAYFHCLKKILVRGEVDTTSVIPQICTYLANRTKDNTSEATLIGCFSILIQAVARGRAIEVKSIACNLTEKYLFPSKKNKYPLCKTTETRTIAFDLLSIMCQYKPDTLGAVLNILEQFHKNMSWRKASLKSWIVPAQEEKSLEGFVGLRNLGATCYMNSVLQQLFMIPHFKDSIFRQIRSENLSGVLHEVTKIMLKLAYSEKPFVSTKRLCEAYKNWDGEPINPREQMDVEEFFAGLFDKMKEDSQDPHVTELIDSVFSCKMINSITGEGECTHLSQRDESCYIVPIEVKNKASVKESLETLVKKEMMEGDSAYNCESCGRKVTAGKQQMFRLLPKVLVLSLRRFEYSVELGRRKKLNDYFEFEDTIDMGPFMERDIQADFSSMQTIQLPATNLAFVYKLKGIVIHMGEAEAGHYISLVSDSKNQRWIEFNDTHVSQIDDKKMKEMAFGTKADGSTPSQVAQTSAYLLLYEKERVDPSILSYESIREVQIPEANKINEKNEEYLYKKCVLKPEYIQFVKRLFTIDSSQFSERILKFAISYFCTIHGRAQITDPYLMQLIFEKFKSTHSAHLWFASMLTSEPSIKEFLIDCPQVLIRKFIVSLFNVCVESLTDNRSEFLGRLLNVLPKLKPPITDRHSSYFEVLYILCRKDTPLFMQVEIPKYLIAQILKEPVRLREVAVSANVSEWGYKAGQNPAVFESPNPDLKPAYAFQLAIIQRCAARLSSTDKESITSPNFMREVVSGAQNRLGALKVADIYSKQIELNRGLLDQYLACLSDFFIANDYDRYRVATVQVKKLIKLNPREEEGVIGKVVQMLQQVLERNRGYVIATAWVLKFIYKMASRSQLFMKVLKNAAVSRFAADWGREYSKFNMGQSNMSLTKVPQYFQQSIYQVVPDISTVLSAFTSGRFPYNEGEGDSDEEFYEADHKRASEVEILLGNTAVVARFQVNFWLLFYAVYSGPGGEKTEFIAADDDRLMAQYTKLQTPQG